jgi:hypothetical protein
VIFTGQTSDYGTSALIHQFLSAWADARCDDCHRSGRRRSHHDAVRIDLDFELLTVAGGAFRGQQLLGRPTILVVLRYLG